MTKKEIEVLAECHDRLSGNTGAGQLELTNENLAGQAHIVREMLWELLHGQSQKRRNFAMRKLEVDDRVGSCLNKESRR
jgi:hypothetical protein